MTQASQVTASGSSTDHNLREGNQKRLAASPLHFRFRSRPRPAQVHHLGEGEEALPWMKPQVALSRSCEHTPVGPALLQESSPASPRCRVLPNMLERTNMYHDFNRSPEMFLIKTNSVSTFPYCPANRRTTTGVNRLSTGKPIGYPSFILLMFRGTSFALNHIPIIPQIILAIEH